MKFLTVIAKAERNWCYTVPELYCIGTHKTYEGALRTAAEAIAFADPQSSPKILDASQLDPEIYGEDDDLEIVFVEPAPMNPVSSQIERAIAKAGITQSELARRLQLPRSNVSRMVNPFYWGHSVETLRRVAKALGVELKIKIGEVA